MLIKVFRTVLRDSRVFMTSEDSELWRSVGRIEAEQSIADVAYFKDS